MVLAVSLFLASCGSDIVDGDRVRGSGAVITQTRTIGAFERIVLAGEGKAVFASGSDGQIEIETDDNLLAHIETDVSGNTLTIRTERGVDIDPTDGVVYRLSCPEINAVTLAGAGTIDLDACATTARLKMDLAGAGTIVARSLDLSDLEASLPGAGSIRVDGRTDRVEVVLSGAGDFDGADLEAVDGDVESTGVGTTSLWVAEQLDIRLSGVGAIRYYGEPSVNETVTGVGTIEDLGPK